MKNKKGFNQTGQERKQAVLVVSFGTTYPETCELTIGAIEKAIGAAFPDAEIRRAFTSRQVIRKLAGSGEKVDQVEEALWRLCQEGIQQVIIQPTHMVNGYEYDKVRKAAASFRGRFVRLCCGAPLLTGALDYQETVKALLAEVAEQEAEGSAIVFVGHGTEHFADAAYAALDYRFKAEGHGTVHVGTVEGYPGFDEVLGKLKAAASKRVRLCPLLIVAGEHAKKDIAGGNEDSWKTRLEKEGYQVSCAEKGLGEYAGIRDILLRHVAEAAGFCSE